MLQYILIVLLFMVHTQNEMCSHVQETFTKRIFSQINARTDMHYKLHCFILILFSGIFHPVLTKKIQQQIVNAYFAWLSSEMYIQKHC